MKKNPLLIICLLVLLCIGNNYSLVAAPTIISFTPSSGAVGTSVTITGTGFNTTLANNIIWFGAVRAYNITSATTTQIVVTVPAGTTNQPISVTNSANGLTVFSSKHFILTYSGGIAINANSFAEKIDSATGAHPYSAAVCDLDVNGKPDVIVANMSNHNLSIFRNTSTSGTLSFAKKDTYYTGTYPYYVATGDLDGDGVQDVVVANQGSNTVSVYLNNSVPGTISLGTEVEYATVSNPMFVHIRDIDGDGRPDLLVASLYKDTISILRNTSMVGYISFASKISIPCNAYSNRLACGDIDGDGKPDVVALNIDMNAVSVYRNISTAGVISLAAKVDFTTGTNPTDVACGDIDGDGKLDLAITNSNSNTISVLRNTSTSGVINSSSFAAKVDFTTAASPTRLAINDMDGDGKPEIAVTYNVLDSVSILRNTTTASVVSFEKRVNYLAGIDPKSITLGDLDSDGRPDMVTANYGSTVTLIRNVNAAPTISSFTPTSQGRYYNVTITGNYLLGATAVTFGGAAAASFDVTSATSITAEVGAGTTSGSVSVTTPLGTASKAGFTFLLTQNITFTALAAKTYGNTAFTVSATSSNPSGNPVVFTSSDPTIATCTGTNGATVTILKSGVCTIYANQAGNATYAPAVQKSQTLTINKAILTATADNKSKIYGGLNPAFTITYSGFVNGDTKTLITEPVASTTATTASSAGSYPISLSGGIATNYNFNNTAGTLTVTKATLTATADNKSKIYGAALPALTITYNGFLNGDTKTSITEPAISTTALAGSIVGTYPISLTGGMATNYSLSLTNGTLTVTKANLFITADSKTKTYGAANPALTMTYTGFVNGDTKASITEPTLSTTATTGSSAGDYNITFTGGSATNYTLNLTIGKLTIDKATLTVTADIKTKVYGSTNPTLTITYAGFVNGDTKASITEPVIATWATTTSSVGSYSIYLTGGSAANYTLNLTNGYMSVTQAALTATADNKSRTYGAANPALTISYSGFVNGDNKSVITEPSISTTATPSSNVGTYPISLSGGSALNYAISLTSGTLNINKAPLTATAENKSKTYGSANPALTIAYTGFVNGENSSAITVPSISTTALLASVVGTYPISLTGGSAGNYTLSLINGTLTINQATLTASADTKSKTYGDANPTLTISYNGFVNGDTKAGITQPTISTTATTSSNAGTYPITLSGGLVNSNYNLSLVNGTFTINKIVLTATADNKSKIYGDVNPNFTISYSGFINGDTKNAITEPTIATTASASSSIGTYPITLSNGAATNYSFNFVSGTLTINKASLTASADNLNKTYGSSNPSLTISYTGFVNGDTKANITEPTIATTANISSAMGIYPITLSDGSAANYNLTLIAGTLTVGKAIITATAENKSKTYGDANPALTISYSGFVNGDTKETVVVEPSISTSVTASTNAGEYPISLSGGSVTGNYYTLTLVNGSFTVNKAILNATAESKSKTYGEDNPSFTVSYSGFVNGDTKANITEPVASTVADKTSSVGENPINLAGGMSSNYTFNLLNGKLTINKATLTATADNQSKVYGDINPALNISYTGFVNGDTKANITEPVATTIATTTSAVGTYPITLAGGISNNYSIVLTNGLLAVNKTLLTVTAQNYTRKQGENNPSFKINYTGFVNSDDSSKLTTKPIATCIADNKSLAGKYDILVSGGVASNYDFKYINGELTVTAISNVQAKEDVELSVYPNPVADYLHIRSSATIVKVEVVNANGQIVKSEICKSSEITIGTADLANGIYTFKTFDSNGRVSTSKIMKR